MTSPLCRLCLDKAEPQRPHYTALFSERSQANDLHGRLSKLCGVPVRQGDGYSNRVCRRCMDKFLSLERHEIELIEFRKLVHNSYSMLSRKRAKETNGVDGVSPNTEKSRPPAKRSRARCLFPSESGKFKQI